MNTVKKTINESVKFIIFGKNNFCFVFWVENRTQLSLLEWTLAPRYSKFIKIIIISIA